MNDIKGKVAIVTGAGSGLGRAIAEYFAQKVGIVVIADINLNAANDTLNRVKTKGGQGFALEVDVGKAEEVDKMVSVTNKEYGRIDYIFNNAGAAINGEFKDMTLSHCQKMMDVNFWGIVYACKSVYPIMIKQGYGSIINVSSFAGLLPGGLMTSYSSSKFAAVGFTLNLRSEAKQYGINVTALCPGYLETPMHESAQNVTDYVIEHDKKYRAKKT
ncbi:MAG TPA: SDR family oxidoreductase [Prolixibacteraceae bacterium]|nr:SDR family oxidoreductase [Prolixibacteraceae bacterium]